MWSTIDIKKCHIDNICVLHWSWSESEVVVIDVSSASVVGSVIKYIEYIFNMLIPTFFQISIFEIKIARLILPVDELSFNSADIFVVIGLSTGSFVIPKFPKKRILINITVSYIAYYNVNVLETIIINKEYYLNCKGLPHIFLVQLNPLSTSLHFCRDLLVFLLKVYRLQPFYWYISVFFSLYQSLRMLRYKHSKSSTCPRFPFLHIKLKRISFSHNMSLIGFNNTVVFRH